MSTQVKRLLKSRVEDALEDTRIVVLQGARQVGKSTLAAEIASRRLSRMVTLDDHDIRNFAKTDPVGFVSQMPGGLLVIDEVQRVPELILTLKAEVDRDQRPGRFLLTGSANLLDLAATHESLAGRAEPLTLYSFSQAELAETKSSFVDRAFSKVDFTSHTGTSDRHAYLELACQGGYPAALARSSRRRRDDWYQTYLAQIVNRDAADISGLQRISDLPRLLRLIAAREGSGMVWSSLGADAGIPRTTLDPYVRLLETLFLTHRVTAWSTNSSTRDVKQPKEFLLDTGLSANLQGVSSEGLAPTLPSSSAGALLESFVVGEIRRQLGWSEQRAAMYHYRDQRGAEVDIVLEAPDGKVLCIEVKAASTVQPKDLRGLKQLGDRLGDRFVAGFVLYTGTQTRVVADRVTALPIDALWRD